MPDPITLIPGTLGLAAQVVMGFTEYLQNVKDAPQVIKSIRLEANTLKGVLETLSMTFEEGIDPAAQASLEECLMQCQETLRELEKLVMPEGGDTTMTEARRDAPAKTHRTSSPYARYAVAREAPAQDAQKYHSPRPTSSQMSSLLLVHLLAQTSDDPAVRRLSL